MRLNSTVLAIVLLQLLTILFVTSGCSGPEPVFDGATISEKVDIGGYGLQTYRKGTGNIAIVFESGLADMSNVWNEAGVFDELAEYVQVIAYNRAGYAPSDPGPEPRGVQRINEETLALLDALGLDRVVLVGHSLGGMFIRSLAIAHPERIAGLVFLDPSHEGYSPMDDPGPEAAISFFEREYGREDIRYKEALELPNTFAHVAGLPPLPDIPVSVITSMRLEGNKDVQDRENWFGAHAQLGAGISEFSHLGTERSGHYIMVDAPDLVIAQVLELLAKVEGP